MKLLPIVLLFTAFLACPLLAVDSVAPVTPGAEVKIYDPLDLETVRMRKGETITVEGNVMLAGEAKSKTVRFLNFSQEYRKAAALVFYVSKGGEAFSMEKLQAWVGKKVRATGKVGEYGSTVQIEIEKWEQVKDLGPATPAAPVAPTKP